MAFCRVLHVWAPQSPTQAICTVCGFTVPTLPRPLTPLPPTRLLPPLKAQRGGSLGSPRQEPVSGSHDQAAGWHAPDER